MFRKRCVSLVGAAVDPRKVVVPVRKSPRGGRAAMASELELAGLLSQVDGDAGDEDDADDDATSKR